MSHFKERKQKNCLNCNATVQGRFCHICGQENIEPKESVWHLISHFFQDITHFDGKFFGTLKYLLFRPGHLSREYMMGRRNSYLNPIRMYVFTSAFFFLFFFSTVSLGGMDALTATEKKAEQVKQVSKTVEGLKEQYNELTDTLVKNTTGCVLADLESQQATFEQELKAMQKKDSAVALIRQRRLDSLLATRPANGKPANGKIKGSGLGFSISDGYYRTVMAYDSVQARLPETAKDGWWRRLWTRKATDVIERSDEKPSAFGKKITEIFLHRLPQMFFLSLPLYAFFLFVLYNREKKYYYVNHAIFSIHIYCATFIICFITILLGKYLSFGKEWLDEVYTLAFFLLALFYQYKALRNFYQQRRAKTIAKFIILCVVSGLAIVLLTMIFFIISLWNL